MNHLRLVLHELSVVLSRFATHISLLDALFRPPAAASQALTKAVHLYPRLCLTPELIMASLMQRLRLCDNSVTARLSPSSPARGERFRPRVSRGQAAGGVN